MKLVITVCVSALVLFGLAYGLSYLVIKKNYDLDSISAFIQAKRNLETDKKNIGAIRYLALSITNYETDEGKLPTDLIALDTYRIIPELVKSSNVEYHLVSGASFRYILCAPYSAKIVPEPDNATSVWSVSTGTVCLSKK